jgi:phosphoribosylformylglycinamidine cyclo-ligase
VRYEDAGVDPERAAKVLSALRGTLESTHGAAVVGGIGGFSGVMRIPAGAGYLVATADGVGTKVLLARELGRDRVVGRDIVHHCVNDCMAAGARPLFFLDYIAFERIDAAVMSEILAGLAEACREQGVALLGGETAEMPGVYAPGAYDLAGFLVGFAAEGELFRRERVAPGDAVIGLASVGLHTNGFSLVRKIVTARGLDLGATYPGLEAPLGDLLLREHASYARAIAGLRERFDVRGLAHITGGGLPENLPRALAPRTQARLRLGSWPTPPVMQFLAREGGVSREDAIRTWNDGVGMAVILPDRQAPDALAWLATESVAAFSIGAIEAGDGGVVFA